MATEPFKSELRLIFQGSVPMPSMQAGLDWYNDLKIWLKSINSEFTLTGQIMKMLEPCCKDRSVIASEAKQSQTKGETNEQHPKIP